MGGNIKFLATLTAMTCALAACGDSSSSTADAPVVATADATSVDAGHHVDAAALDASVSDGAIDAGVPDAVIIDANTNDADLLDADRTDANVNELQASWTPEFNKLVGYWTLDGVVGTNAIFDDFIGAVIGKIGQVTGDKPLFHSPGLIGEALSFDTNHFILTTTTGTVSGSYSVQTWVKFDSSQDFTGSIFGTRNENFFDFKINSSNQVHGDLSGASADGNDTFATGVWHQIVYAISPTTLTIYHNGVLISTDSISSPTTLYSGGSGLTFGACGPTCDPEFFGGDMDEAAIWNSTLSPTDVATLYSNGIAGIAISADSAPQFANIVDYFNFDGTGILNKGDTVTAAIGPNGLMDGNGSSTPPAQISYVDGEINQALSCPGDNNHVVIAQPGTLFGEFTISAWINPDANSYGSGSAFGTQAGGNAFDLQLNGDQTVHIDIGDGQSSSSVDGTTSLDSSTWHYVTYTAAASQFALYVDGVLDSSGPIFAGPLTAPELYGPTHDIFIGDDNSNDSRFGGAMDEVAIWSTNLSANDVKSLYTHGIAGQAIDSSWTPQFADITSYWNFDQPGPLGHNATVTAAIGFNGTLLSSQGANSSVSSIAGVAGNAFQFDQQHYIRATAATALNGSYTVQTWVYYANDNDNTGEIFGTRSPVDYSFAMSTDGSGLYAEIGDGTQWIAQNAGVNLTEPTGQWNQIVYSVTANGYSIYFNGELVSTFQRNVPLLFDRAHPIALCDDSTNGDNPFEGQLDDVAIWSTALTADQVQQIYTRQSQ